MLVREVFPAHSLSPQKPTPPPPLTKEAEPEENQGKLDAVGKIPKTNNPGLHRTPVRTRSRRADKRKGNRRTHASPTRCHLHVLSGSHAREASSEAVRKKPTTTSLRPRGTCRQGFGKGQQCRGSFLFPRNLHLRESARTQTMKYREICEAAPMWEQRGGRGGRGRRPGNRPTGGSLHLSLVLCILESFQNPRI